MQVLLSDGGDVRPIQFIGNTALSDGGDVRPIQFIGNRPQYCMQVHNSIVVLKCIVV